MEMIIHLATVLQRHSTSEKLILSQPANKLHIRIQSFVSLYVFLFLLPAIQVLEFHIKAMQRSR